MKIKTACDALNKSEDQIKKLLKGNKATWKNLTGLLPKKFFSPLESRVLTFSQNKGGVGKTTSTVNIGYLFSLVGKTLLIDLDSQGNLSQAFNLYDSELFLSDLFFSKAELREVIRNTEYDNLDVIPNNLNFDDWLKDHPKDDYQALSKIIKSLDQEYKYILIDCPPSLSSPFDLAINAATHAVILLEPHSFSSNGLQNIYSKIKSMEAAAHVKILGSAFNRYKKSILFNTIITEAKADQDFFIFDTIIRDNIAIPESQMLKKPVFAYDENSKGSIDYFKFWVEILEGMHD